MTTTLETPPRHDLPTDAPAPEILLPQLSETIDELNQKLADQGDTLDRVKSLRRIAGVGTMAVGTFVLGVNEAMFSVFAGHDTIPGAIAMAGIVGVTTAGTRKFNRSRQRKRSSDILDTQYELQQHFDGEVVEVFTAHNKKNQPEQRTVVWNGNTDIDEPLSDYVTERLKQLREVAVGVRADEVGIPKKYLEDYIGDDAIGYVEEFDSWLKRYKKLSVADQERGEDEVRFVKLDELDDLIDLIEVTSQSEEPLRSIMKVLAHYKPTHPARTWYELRSQNPEQANKQLKGLFKSSIERRLQDVERGREIDEDFVVETPKIHTLGRLRSLNGKAKIDWHQAEKNLHLATSDLLGQYKLQYSDLQRILAHPESFSPSKVVELCELAAWLTLEGHDTGIESDEGLGTGVLPALKETTDTDVLSFGERMQRQLLGVREGRRIHKEDQDINESTQAFKRTIKAMAMVGLASYLGMGIGRVSDNYVTEKRYESNAAYGYAYDFYETSQDPIVRAYATVENGLDQFHGVSNNITSLIQQRLGIQYSPEDASHLQRVTSPPTGSDNGDNNNDPAIGNINRNEENKPMWYIQAYGGMDSKGYWTENTYNRFKWHGVDWQEDYDSPQDPDTYKRALSESVALPASLTESADPRLRVQRLLNFDGRSQGSYPDVNYGYNSPYKWVNVPTKEGTRIVAASIDGKPGVKVYTMTDGLQVLLVPKDVSSDTYPKLEYWLQEDPQSPRPKFKEAVDFYEVGKNHGGDDPGTLAARVNNLWQPLVPGLPASGMYRVDQQQAYIQNNFKYSLAPLGEPKLTEDKTRYVSYVLGHKEANCNVAATLLNISNPDELNLATGYDNLNQNDDGSAVLALHEAHAWNIDKQGNIHDSTPVSGLTEDDKKFFEENFTEKEPTSERQKQQEKVLMMAKLGALAAAGVTLFRKRTQMNSARISVQRKAATRVLARTDRQTVHMAAATLDYATYGPDKDKLENALSAKSPSVESEREIIEGYGANGFKQALQNLKAVQGTTKDERKAKRLAKRLVRKAYNASR